VVITLICILERAFFKKAYFLDNYHKKTYYMGVLAFEGFNRKTFYVENRKWQI